MATAVTPGAHVELLLAQAGRHLSNQLARSFYCDEPIQLIVMFTMLAVVSFAMPSSTTAAQSLAVLRLIAK